MQHCSERLTESILVFLQVGSNFYSQQILAGASRSPRTPVLLQLMKLFIMLVYKSDSKLESLPNLCNLGALRLDESLNGV